MVRLVAVKIFLIMFLCTSAGYAEQYKIAPSPNAPGFDYFTSPEVPSPEQPANSRTYRNLITSAHTDKIPGWIQQGRMQDAINDVVYTLDRFANHPKGLQLAAMVASIIKRPSLAVYYFDRALKLYPQHAITYAQYGAYLIGSGQTDAGIEQLKEAVERDQKLAGAYALLAKAYTKNGNLDLAREAAEKARDLGYKGEMR
jgi:Tfp pilus assembly protein PilF